MKTVIKTFVSGIFVCLMTSIGVDTELEIYDQNFNTTETTQQYNIDEDYAYEDEFLNDDEIIYGNNNTGNELPKEK
jgi:hypothetical protein